MSNQVLEKINIIQKELNELEVKKDLSQAQRVIASVIKLLDDSVSVDDQNLYQLFTDSDGKIRANASWFYEDSVMTDRKATYKIHPNNNLNLDLKLYGISKPTKRTIAWSQALTPNFEDEPFNKSFNVGIDFIVPKTADKIIIVLSNNWVIRTLELKGELTVTYQEILSKWAQISDFSKKDEIHNILWESFDIQPLNKKFYAGISERFTLLRQYLVKEKVFDERHASLFANRLIGRIIFTWFLDKKGIINPEIGYFDSESYEDDNEYYRERLERLFFGVLNTPIEDREYKDNQTPFLNGGLFEPRENDLYKISKLHFPKNYFDELFKFLSSYNFTTDESTSQFQQVAIDPEMLGRIFENLLAEMTEETGEQARKAKGAFYTPREIVDYMCRESLKEYLKTKIKDDENLDQRLYQLIDAPDKDFQDQDHNWRRDWKPYKPDIMKALDELKVLDLACGSGAFPIGMLQLLVKVYERLEARFSSYNTKLGIIENNIYGVDIEPMAVEIARLRAWLSIVVDEESDSKKIKPLPNLEFKFICANSLIDLDKKSTAGFGDDPELQEKIREIRDSYFKTESLNKKKKLRDEYEKLLGKGESLFGESEKSRQLKTYKPFDNESQADFFNSIFMFGISKFDLIVGNPPYVNVRKIDPYLKESYKKSYKSALGQYDLYILFIERSLNLLTENGSVCFITSNKFLISGYGKKIRSIIAKECCIKDFIDYSKDKVFENASVYPVVYLINNSPCLSVKDQDDYNLIELFGFVKTDPIVEKLDSIEEKLNDFVLIKEAIHTGNVRDKLIKKEEGKDRYKLLRGKDVSKYKISWQGLFIDYSYPLDKNNGEYANLIDKKYFLEPKIFLREIALSPTAVYDDEGYFTLNKSYVLFPEREDLNLKYIVGILNSTLISYYFENKFGDVRVSGGYLQFKKQFTSKIPIIYKTEYVEKVSKIVDEITNLKKSESDTSELDKKLNDLVFEIYQISEDDRDKINKYESNNIS